MFDIEPFVRDNFPRVWLYGAPTSDYRVNCPFCIGRYGSPDDKGKLHISINPERPVVHCFRCNYSSNWYGLVKDITGENHIKILKELYVTPDVSDFSSVAARFKKSEEDIKIPEKKKVKLPDDFVGLNSESGPFPLLYAQKYMRHRGLDREYWEKYNIGVAPSQGMRVIIPIEDDYWQARRLFEWVGPKYTNPSSESSGVIFNSEALGYNEVVICEGAFSAMFVGENAVAILRKDATNLQVRRFLNSSVSKFIIALEPGAFSSMKKLADRLVAGGRKVILWNYIDGDPADHDNPPEIIEYNLKSKLEFMLFR